MTGEQPADLAWTHTHRMDLERVYQIGVIAFEPIKLKALLGYLVVLLFSLGILGIFLTPDEDDAVENKTTSPIPSPSFENTHQNQSQNQNQNQNHHPIGYNQNNPSTFTTPIKRFSPISSPSTSHNNNQNNNYQQQQQQKKKSRVEEFVLIGSPR